MRKEGKKNFKKRAREQRDHKHKEKSNHAQRPARFDPKGKGQKRS
jgi:hypothetical protein